MDHTDQEQTAAVGVNRVMKPLTRLQQLQSEQTSLIKRLNQVSLMIEFLKDREYLQEALYEFDKLDRFGW